MGRPRKLDLSPLGRLNAALPPGVRASIANNAIIYNVASSYVDPLGYQIKKSLGSFRALSDAVTALYSWKAMNDLKHLDKSLIASVESSLKDLKGTIEDMSGAPSLLPSAHFKPELDAQILATLSEAQKNSMFSVLDKTPFHLVPIEGDMRCEDGSLISAAVIAAWFKKFESPQPTEATEQAATGTIGTEAGWSEEALAEFRKFQESQEANEEAEDS